MPMEAPPSLSPKDRQDLLRTDRRFMSSLGAWIKFNKTPQRPEFWQQLHERRSAILNAVDPQAEVNRSNAEYDLGTDIFLNARASWITRI